jgi:very-short-patch-repair endonuclease
MPTALREDPSSLSRSRERVRVRARSLRKDQTDAEALLWSKLRSRQLLGLKFRRQHPLGSYFADFACIEIGLIVELDGGQHAKDASGAYDAHRSEELAAMGFRVLRFWNNDVLNETSAVLEKIHQTAKTLTPTLSRKREREKSGAERDHKPALTPTLSRKREREQDKEPT